MVDYAELTKFVCSQVNLSPIITTYQLFLRLRGANITLYNDLCKYGEGNVGKRYAPLQEIRLKYLSYIKERCCLDDDKQGSLLKHYNEDTLKKFFSLTNNTEYGTG